MANKLFIRPPLSHGITSCHRNIEYYLILARHFEIQLPRVKLNQWQCGSLKTKLSESLDSVNEILVSTLTSSSPQPSGWELCMPVLRELDRIVAGAKALMDECCTQEWLKAAIKVADSEELFVKYHAELEWCVALLRIASAGEDHHERVEQLSRFDWDASDHFIRSSIQKAALKDCNEFLELLNQKISTSTNPAERNLAQFLLHKFDSGRPGTSGESVLVVERPHSLGIQERGSFIGSGGYAEVFKNGWMGETYARKVFKRIGGGIFKKETKMLADLFHPHIVPMVCSFVDPQGNGCMLMELMSEDLEKLVERKTASAAPAAAPFELSKAVDIMLQIGEGMKFLHQKKWSHRDLKPSNVLVNSEPDLVVKIGDFGMAKLKQTSASKSEQTSNVGTTRWRAPELFREVGRITADAQKGDVWSFALICAQILTGKCPFDNVVPSGIYVEITTNGARPDLPSTVPGGLVKLLQACWDIDPSKRPLFSYICRQLRLLKGILLTGGVLPECCSIPPQLSSQPQSREVYGPLLGATDSRSTVTRALVVGNSKAETTTLIRKLSRTNTDHRADLEESMLPSLPLYFYNSRGLDHKKQLDSIANFVRTRNSSWTIDSVIRRWHLALRPWYFGTEGPLSRDRIHIVWFVYAISETPHLEWAKFFRRIKKYKLPVQIVVTHYPGQDPKGDKLSENFLVKRDLLQCPRKEQVMTVDLDMSRIDMLPADSLSTEDHRYLQNPNDNSIWDACQVMRTAGDIEQASRIISDLRMTLGWDGFTIPEASFRNSSKSHSYTQSAIFFFRTLCQLWGVPQNLQTALAKKVVGMDSFADRDHGNFKLKPGSFLLFSVTTAALILYMKIVHYPRGWKPVGEAKYEADIDQCCVYLDTKLKDRFDQCALEKQVPRFYITKTQASKKLTRYLETFFEKFLEVVREDNNVSCPPTSSDKSSSPLSPDSTTPVPYPGYSFRSVLQMLLNFLMSLRFSQLRRSFCLIPQTPSPQNCYVHLD